MFDNVRVCGVEDRLGGDNCLWPFLDVNVYATGLLGQVSLPNAVEQAIAGWNNVCGIRLKLTDDPNQAHIIVGTGRIDGSLNTLAISELPCGFTRDRWRAINQKYDTSESWVISDTPPEGKIDAVRVICHELGHAIGISHIESGNLMAPVYSNSIRWPKSGDIVQAKSRYFRPSAIPTPTQPAPNPGTTPVPPANTPPRIKITIEDLTGRTWKSTNIEWE